MKLPVYMGKSFIFLGDARSFLVKCIANIQTQMVELWEIFFLLLYMAPKFLIFYIKYLNFNKQTGKPREGKTMASKTKIYFKKVPL